FQTAFAARIGERLQHAREQAMAEIAQLEAGPQSTSTALALTEKALEVTSAYQEMSSARGTWGGYASTGRTSRAAFQAGHRAADRARLGGQAELPEGRRQVGS